MLSVDCKEGSNDVDSVRVGRKLAFLDDCLNLLWSVKFRSSADNWVGTKLKKKVSKGFDRPWKWIEEGSDWRYMSRDRDEMINLYFCWKDR